MDIKPLKLDIDGKVKQLQNGDSLPVETIVAQNRDLINRILINLNSLGITLADPILMNQLAIALQTT